MRPRLRRERVSLEALMELPEDSNNNNGSRAAPAAATGNNRVNRFDESSDDDSLPPAFFDSQQSRQRQGGQGQGGQGGEGRSNQSRSGQSQGGQSQQRQQISRQSNQQSGRRGNRQTSSRPNLGNFLNSERTAVRTPAHATALSGLVQLASGHPDGVIGALGHGNRNNWIRDNVSSFFQPDGPFAAFQPVNAATLQRSLSAPITLARSFYTRDHSDDTTGAAHEDIPDWARRFFPLFEAQQNYENNNARTAAARDNSRSVARSFIGAQAPLGQAPIQGPARLRTETSRNIGSSNLRQQSIGGVSAESVSVEDITDNPGDASQEGSGDSQRRRPAQRVGNGNGRNTRRRLTNVQLDASFDPASNDPRQRHQDLRYGYQSMDNLADSIGRYAEAASAPLRPPPPPPRSIMNIVTDYQSTAALRDSNNIAEDTAFYNNALSGFRDELNALLRNQQQHHHQAEQQPEEEHQHQAEQEPNA